MPKISKTTVSFDPEAHVAEIDKQQNIEDRNLIMKPAKSIYNAIENVAKQGINNLMGTPAQNAESDKRLEQYSKGEGILPAVERAIRGGINNPLKGQGSSSDAEVSKKRGGRIKANEWHGFKGGKTGNNKHGF